MSHINSVRHIGKVARKQDDRPLIHGMNLMLLRFCCHVDASFGFALLEWDRTKQYFERRAKKAVNQASINQKDIQDYQVFLPPLYEQRSIAAVLDAIDEAIEHTDTAISATERLRDALLHELLTRGVRGWHTEWRNIPSLGTFPIDWEVVRLGDLAEVKGGTGFPLVRQGRRSGNYLFIKVSDMTLDGNETHIHKANNYVDQRDANELRATIFTPGTVVFPKVGAAIATNKKRALTLPTIIDNNMVGVTVSSKQRCDARFLHRWFESVDITQFANVSAVPSITGSRLKRESLSLPPLPEQRAIADVLDGVDHAIDRSREERERLQLLKASATEALLTGQTRMPMGDEE